MRLLSPLKNNIDSLVAAFAGFLVILLFTRHGGIGICPDGVVYSTTAENICTAGSLTDFTHNSLVDFPAFYSVFLSAIMRITGLKPLAFEPVVNGLLFGTAIYLSGSVMERFPRRSRWYKIALLSCIIFSPCLLEVYSMIWSETIFIVLILLFIIALQQYFQAYARSALIAAAALAALAAVTRYAGITIIGTGGLLILINSGSPRRRKITDLALFSLISPSLFIINLIRNYTATGTLMGPREIAIRTLADNFKDTGTVFHDWLPFPGNYDHGNIMLTPLILVAAIATCGIAYYRHRRLSGYYYISAAFTLIYLLFMIISASLSRFEQLNSRFLSPIFIPLLWIASYPLLYLAQATARTRKKWLAATVVCSLVFIGFQYNQFAADYETWDGVKDAGIPGYTEDQWRYSKTVNFIRRTPSLFRPGYTMYANAYDAVYFFTKEPGYFLPHKESAGQIQRFLANRHCYVVWFNDGENADLVDLHFLLEVKKMKLMKQFDDGAVYSYDN